VRRLGDRFLTVTGKVLSLMSRGGEALWSIKAGAVPGFIVLSPSHNVVGFRAGRKVWVASAGGEIIQVLDQPCVYAFVGDDGSAVTLDSRGVINKVSPHGRVEQTLSLDGRWKNIAKQYKDMVATVTSHDDEDTLWVFTLGGHVVLRWRAYDRITSVTWAVTRPFVLVHTRRGVAGFSVSRGHGT
jgi:hypothetical protein